MNTRPTLSLDCAPIKGRKVCVTGRLLSMTHAELGQLVVSCEGVFVRMPARDTAMLVVGDAGWPAEGDGSPSQALLRARELRAKGYPVELVGEDEFLERIGMSDPAGTIRGHHTIVDLSRILRISPVRIRRWVRTGLIIPAKTIHRLAYFDFRQVSFARRLCELLEAGVSLKSIRQGMEQFEGWLPDARDHLLQLARWERGAYILVRLNDKLYDASGQRYFDFDADETVPNPISIPSASNAAEVADLFDKALELEDKGRLEEAVDTYRRAIELAPDDPTLRFNLGNVLYGLGQLHEASGSFGEALAHDPRYAEAWNNLGNIYAELERWEDAADALQQALQLVPNYGDAHYNLAAILEHVGRPHDADAHRKLYHQFSPEQRWPSRSERTLSLFRGDEESN